MTRRRAFLCGGASLALGGCFDRPCHEANAEQKRFLDGLAALAKPALTSSNPLAIEDAAKQSVALANKVGAFSEWCGTLRKIEGSAETVAVTIEVGPNVSLHAFNDWTLAMAGSLTDLLMTGSRQSKPPGLSEAAIAALKTVRLGDRVQLAGRMGEIAGSGLFELSRLLGKSEAENRQFLQTPRFVARIEALGLPKKS